jgi:hypothetical protein
VIIIYTVAVYLTSGGGGGDDVHIHSRIHCCNNDDVGLLQALHLLTVKVQKE